MFYTLIPSFYSAFDSNAENPSPKLLYNHLIVMRLVSHDACLGPLSK
jgi:hypothetical protein